MCGQRGEHGRDSGWHGRFHRSRHRGQGLGAGGLGLLNSREIFRDLLLGAAGEDAVGVVFDVPAGLGFGVFLFDDQPLVAFAAVFHLDQRELAAQLFAVQPELQVAAIDLGLAGRVPQ